MAWGVRGQEQRLFRQAADQVLNKGPIITLSLGENPLHIRLALPNFFALKKSFSRSRLAGFVFFAFVGGLQHESFRLIPSRLSCLVRLMLFRVAPSFFTRRKRKAKWQERHSDRANQRNATIDVRRPSSDGSVAMCITFKGPGRQGEKEFLAFNEMPLTEHLARLR